MHALLFHNPTAGTGSHAADGLASVLQQAGYTVTYSNIKEQRYKTALKEHADLVVVAGGDGAVARVVRNLHNRNIPIAILPLGTANNIARSLGIEGDADALLECLRRPAMRRLDVGRIIGPWGRRRFAEAVGVGAVARSMQRSGSKPAASDRIRIGREALRVAVAEAIPQRLILTVDGHELVENFLLIEILNIRFVGPALPIGPLSAPGDQLLDVVYLSADSRSEMLAWLENPERTPPPLTIRQGSKVILQWERDFLHIDDRMWPAPRKPAKLKIKLEPESVQVCVPTTKSESSPIRAPRGAQKDQPPL
jgi:diacylglycerol kinase (ATP)